MSIGIMLYGSDPTHQVPIARRAEELGFDHLWVGEHIVVPDEMDAKHPYGTGASRSLVESADPRMYDVWTLIGALAAATRSVTISTGIYLLALRHPIVSARAAITAHQLSRGRFMFAVGAGWLGSEFRALGVSFEDRAARFDESLDVLEKLFAGGPVEHHGAFYDFPRLALVKEPVGIPILMGGTKRPALRRAARRGDGWYGTTVSLEENLRIRDDIERFRREFGCEQRPFTYYNRIAGGPIAENLERYRAEGFDNLVIPWQAIHAETSADHSLDAELRSLEKTAKEIDIEGPLNAGGHC